jgi:hypothetical protein
MLRRILAVAVVLTGLSLAAVALAAGPATAQEDEQPVTTTLPVSDEDSPLGDIIPRPNSGRAPDSPNDPGGWQQYLVFALIIGGMAAIVMLVRRSSRRALASRPD